MAEDSYLLALTDPVEGREAEYNRWYDEVHIHDMLALPGVVWGRRYTLHEGQPAVASDSAGASAPAHRYLALYRFSGDPDALMEELGRRMAAGDMSVDPSLDLATASMHTWVPLGDARTAPAAGRSTGDGR